MPRICRWLFVSCRRSTFCDQHKPQNSLDTIVPEFATAWVWNAGHTEWVFALLTGVKWHDGKLLTSAEVKRIWDAVSGHECGKMGKSLKQAWSGNLEKITGNGLLEASFHLKNLTFSPRGGSMDDPD